MFRTILQDTTSGLTWQAPLVCCVVYRTPWRTAWTTDNMSHHGPVPFPCLKYPGKKPQYWLIMHQYIIKIIQIKIRLVLFGFDNNTVEPALSWHSVLIKFSRLSWLMKYLDNWILYITTLYITLKVRSVQITDTSLYTKWNGQSHPKTFV